MNRFDRIVALLIQLQTRRVVSGPALAAQFGVSVRTIYRDIRTLELAGVPLFGEPNVGYSLAEGYRLPPVMFTREEAAALLTAEKLAARLTDAPTAQLSTAAMDKLRAVLRRTDRDYLHTLTPHIQVVRHTGQPEESTVYQQLVAAVATQQVVRIQYQAMPAAPASARNIEPIGLYLTQHWHVVAYCRLRQAFRNFRLDRIQHLALGAEFFAPRPETLQHYWTTQASQWQREKVVLGAPPTTIGHPGQPGAAPARHQAPVRLGPRAQPARWPSGDDPLPGLFALPGGLAAALRRGRDRGGAARPA